MAEFLKRQWILIVILLFAISIRFLYFPNNIYFGYDQARDAFVVQELLEGNLRLVGPTTLIDGLFHGPLYYYIFAPFHFLSGGNPEIINAFLRVLNATGVVWVFLIGYFLFGRKTGLLAAFLYAISFEQTQFAIYQNHPSLSVQAVLIYYLGLVLLLFKKKWWGLVVAALGWGVSIQLEFPLIYLGIGGFILLLGLGRFGYMLPKMSFKQMALAAGVFLMSIATFILAEFKFNFKGIQTLIFGILFSHSETKPDIFSNITLIYSRFIADSIFSIWPGLIGLLIFFLAIFYIWKKYELKKTVFLLVWFGIGLIPYLKNTASIPLYYYSGGASVAAVIFVSFLLVKLGQKRLWLSWILVILIVLSNIYQIQKYNPFGTLPSINVQSGMLWSDQKKIVDYIYQDAAGQPFAVNALSVPLNVNIVWSYVFEQYGAKKYGYLPVWGGNAASGYAGHLKVETSRSELPMTQYLIIEPIRGIEKYMVDDFMNVEDIFTRSNEEKQFGLIKVQKRQRI